MAAKPLANTNAKCVSVVINKNEYETKKGRSRQFFRPKHFLVCDIMRDIFALRWESVCCGVLGSVSVFFFLL